MAANYTAIVLVGIPFVQRSTYAVGIGNVVDRHAALLNAESAEVCGERGIAFVPADDAAEATGPDSADHRRLAERIAVVLAPALAWLASGTPSRTGRSVEGLSAAAR